MRPQDSAGKGAEPVAAETLLVIALELRRRAAADSSRVGVHAVAIDAESTLRSQSTPERFRAAVSRMSA